MPNLATRSFFTNGPGVPVSIAISKPKEFVGIELPAAKPSWFAVTELKDTGDWNTYADKYRKLLASRRTAILTKVEQLLDEYTDATFRCWCKEPETCHRDLFADWLENEGWSVDRG
jgi:uncharacterized protein YeaO (DUF488 family)